ncbi:MAG: hypothetical protein Q9191_006897 [Dirinaria sp. TL-2023a]
MADFAPPTGPPPPKVPEGWKAVFNDQYKEWFYVNKYTKQSTWERPNSPVYPSSPSAPGGPPPSYTGGGVSGPEKGHLSTNNPYSSDAASKSQGNVESDAAYAARLQAEENARAEGRPSSRGASDDYYGRPSSATGGYPGGQGQQSNVPYDQQQLPPREQKSKGLGGLLGKLTGKHGGAPQQGYPPQQGYGGQPQYAQQGEAMVEVDIPSREVMEVIRLSRATEGIHPKAMEEAISRPHQSDMAA